jgi:glucose-1-phosphate thymidylyltransferase
VNRVYQERDRLCVSRLRRGIAWLDAGMYEPPLQAVNFVRMIEERQGSMIGCPKVVAYRMEFIPKINLQSLAGKRRQNCYAIYLDAILDNNLP